MDDELNQRRASSASKVNRISNYYYRNTQILGQGYTSIVYRGFSLQKQKQKGPHKACKQQVAIKKLNTDLMQDQLHETLFNSELETLERLKGCQQMLNLHETVKNDDGIYIITEVCSRDLGRAITERISLRQGEKYVKQIIQGFGTLFQRGIIHRDLKPPNFLIDSNGCLKYADFGFATNPEAAAEQSNYNISSPLYMAPEILNRNDYSFQSDIWALGIVIFEIFTGRTPWKANSKEQLYEVIKSNDIVSILKAQKAIISSSVRQLICKSLAFFKSERITPENFIAFEIDKPKSQSIRRSSTRSQKGAISEIDAEPTELQIRPPNKNRVLNLANTAIHSKQQSNTVDTNKSTQQSSRCQPSNLSIKKADTELEPLSVSQIQKYIRDLVTFINLSRLLFKTCQRIKAVSSDQVDQSIRYNSKSLMQYYCDLIVDNLMRVRNYSSNNFMKLPIQYFEQLIRTKRFLKLKKVCDEYLQKYQKCSDLEGLWNNFKAPNIQMSLKKTDQLIIDLQRGLQFTEKCENTVILLDFLLFCRESLHLVKEENLSRALNWSKMETYVDFLPAGASIQRFKQIQENVKELKKNEIPSCCD